MEEVIVNLGYVVIFAPLALFVGLGSAALLKVRLSERATGRAVQAAVVTALLAAILALVLMIVDGTRRVTVSFGNWVLIEDYHYHFTVKFVFDRLSVAFVILSLVLCGTIGAFCHRYLHREEGFSRFFLLLSLFVVGMVIASLSDTIETLFAGWEIVGLSSAFLVAFYQGRPAPPRNGLWVWVIYRTSDAALLLAAVVLHHMRGEGDFDKVLGLASWPDSTTSLPPDQSLVVGLLLLVAAAGKSALIPFSGWLPRAMEGPTPSSAIFYGALSVHLGAFLLLRVSPLIAASVWLTIAVVSLGVLTACYASLAGAVQTDIKSALSFACLAQVGIIVAEIGLGLQYVALVHLIGHACLRTLQFLRTPHLLADHRAIENALGQRLPRPSGLIGRLPADLRDWLYCFALERGHLDTILTDYVARPFVRLFSWFNLLEQRLTALINYGAGPKEDATQTEDRNLSASPTRQRGTQSPRWRVGL